MFHQRISFSITFLLQQGRHTARNMNFDIKQVPRNAPIYNTVADRSTGYGTLPCSREIFLENDDSLGCKEGDK